MPEDKEPRELPRGVVRSKAPTAGSPSPKEGEPAAAPVNAAHGSAVDRAGAVSGTRSKYGSTGNTLLPSRKGGGVITAIEAQQKRAGRVSVYVDGRFTVGLFADVAAALGLKVGQTITPERLEEAARAETMRRALEDAYTLLSYRDRAEKELADRLTRKGYEEEIVATTLEKLRGVGYLDDAAFARRWVAARGQARGKRALAQELRLKGVDRDTAAEALADSQDDAGERAAARLAAVRRVSERPADTSREARARLAAFLQRRGFGWDVVRPVLAELYGVRDGDDAAGEADTESGTLE